MIASIWDYFIWISLHFITKFRKITSLWLKAYFNNLIYSWCFSNVQRILHICSQCYSFISEYIKMLFRYHVINIQKWLKCVINIKLKDCKSIYQFKEHHLIFKLIITCVKNHFSFIALMNLNAMINVVISILIKCLAWAKQFNISDSKDNE